MGFFKRKTATAGYSSDIEAKQAAAAYPSGPSVDAFRIGRTMRPSDEWQDRVRRFDRDGPGFVGFSLDTVATIGSMGRPYIEYYDPDTKEWAEIDLDKRPQDRVVCDLAFEFSNPNQSTQELMYKGIRTQESVGEQWLRRKNRPGWGHGIEYDLLESLNIGDNRLDEFGRRLYEIRTNPAASKGEPGWEETPKNDLSRMWVEDPHWPDLPTSTMRRALGDVERYVDFVRNSRAMSKSRLLNNGMYWASTEAAMAYARANTKQGKPINPNQLHEDIARAGKRSITDDCDLGQHLMFGLSTPKEDGDFKVLKPGYKIDPAAFAGEQVALEGFARTVMLPTKSIIQGVGDGNHWSDWLLVEEVIRSGVAPKVAMFTREMDRVYLRPTLSAFIRNGIWVGEPAHYRFAVDFTNVIKRPDQSEALLDALYAGSIDHVEYVTEGLGLPASSALELPEGLTPYEYARQMFGDGGRRRNRSQRRRTNGPPQQSSAAVEPFTVGLELWDDDESLALPEVEGVSTW